MRRLTRKWSCNATSSKMTTKHAPCSSIGTTHGCAVGIHLRIELNAPPPAPQLRDQVVVRKIDQRRDWPQVGAALSEAFADHWGQLRPSVELAANDADDGSNDADDVEEDDADDPYFNSPDFCFVALHGDRVAGSCLCNARDVEFPDQGRVGSLSVLRQYRGVGIGRALMLHAFRAFYDHGIPPREHGYRRG